jgi:hypothetical protein
MQAWMIQILMMIIDSVLTDDVLLQIKKFIVEKARELVKDTSNSIDDRFVEILADFLGVE